MSVVRVAFREVDRVIGRNADNQLVVIRDCHCSLLRLTSFVAGACFQGEDQIAVILIQLVINEGNAVVGCIKASGDGHLGGALVGRCHEVSGLAHRQVHSERFTQHHIRRHAEDGMTVVAFPQAGRSSSDGDGRLVVIPHIHSGHSRLTSFVASA